MDGTVIWFTGLSGSGKSTLCHRIAEILGERNVRTRIVDADQMRQGLCSDLGYSLPDRVENIRRLAHVAGLLVYDTPVVLVAAITPLEEMRSMIKVVLPSMIEVYVNAPLSVCEERDVKGLYRRAREGSLQGLTGIDSPFEIPSAPGVVCETAVETVEESAMRVVEVLRLGWQETKEENGTRRPCIAVDFDGVIAEYDGWKGPHVLGEPRPDVRKVLCELRKEGWKIVIHTTRSESIVGPYLDRYEVIYDEINRNSDYVTGSGKPVATVYWDDRAFRYSGDAVADLARIRDLLTWSGRR